MKRLKRVGGIFLLVLLMVGPSWSAWDEFNVDETIAPIIGVYRLSFISPDEGWAIIPMYPFRVLHTMDGGKTWQEIYTNSSLDAVFLEPTQHLQFLSSTEGWMIPQPTAAGLYHTSTGGTEWNPVPHPFDGPFAKVSALFFRDTQTGWIAGQSSEAAGMIAATTTGGSTWVIQKTPGRFNGRDLFFIDDLNGWVAGSLGSIYYTRDGGRTWKSSLVQTTEQINQVRFIDTQYGWAVGSGGIILYSQDGGVHWYSQPSGTDADLYSILALNKEEAFAAGTRVDRGVLLVTRNGGASWKQEELPTNAPLYSTASSGNHIWVAGGSSLATPYQARVFHRTYTGGQYPVIDVAHLPGGTVGIPYEFKFKAYNGTPPYQWEMLEFNPSNLTLNPTTGVLSGIPNKVKDFLNLFRVTDAQGKQDYRALEISVIADRLELVSPTLPVAVHRRPYQVPLNVKGGHGPCFWSIKGNTPGCLSINHQNVLVGTPQQTGAFDFTIEVIDSGSLPQRSITAVHLDVIPLVEETWDIEHANNRITDIHFFNANQGIAIGWSGGVYQTFNGGLTWEFQSIGASAWDFDWAGDQGWLIGSLGVGHSTDRGETWTFKPAELSQAKGIVFKDALHGWLFGDGIAWTENGGQTWQRAQTPPGHYYFSLDFASDLVGYAGGDNFTFDRSLDGGKTWQPATLPPYPKEDLHFAKRISRSKSDQSPEKATSTPQINGIYFLDGSRGWIGTNIQANMSLLYYTTTDGGGTWTKRNVGGKGVLDKFQFLPDGLHGWMGGPFSGNLYRTTDGGASWQTISFGGSCHILGFQFIDEQTGWVLPNVVGRFNNQNSIVDLEGSIWKSEDGGSNFTLQYGWLLDGNQIGQDHPLQDISPGPRFEDLSFVDPSHGWALARNTWASSAHSARILFTDNGGVDWKQIGSLEFGVERLHFANQKKGFALHPSDTIPPFETRDGGIIWSPRPDILELVENGIDSSWGDVTFADDRHGWIVFNGDYDLGQGTRVVLRTEDGGKSWSVADKTTRGGRHRLFFLDPNRGWMVNNHGFIESTSDGGKTWNIQRSNADGLVDFNSILFINEWNGWAAGTNGKVFQTSDGGQSWVPANLPGDWQCEKIFFNTCLKGWLAGFHSNQPNVDDFGNPLLVGTTNGIFGASELDSGLVNHPFLQMDSPDGVNLWILGDYGAGLKYSAPSQAFEVITPTLPAARTGFSYAQQLQTHHGQGTITWQICGGALPPGLVLESGGWIKGTPSQAGGFRFTAAATDGDGNSTGRRFQLRVEPDLLPVIVTQSLPDGKVGEDYSTHLEATGSVPPYTWSLMTSESPPGINLLPYGALGGFPQIPGTYFLQFEVEDNQNPPGHTKKILSLTIQGSFAPSGEPMDCSLWPFFCLALHWKADESGLEVDFDQDGDVDAHDALEILRRARNPIP